MIEQTRVRANEFSASVGAHSRPPNDEVRKAAEQFESVLLSSLFQKLQNSVSLCSGEDEDPSSKSFGELGIEQLATSAAKSGGIGISKMVTDYLEGKSQSTGPGSSPLKLFTNTSINELYWQNSEVVRK